MYDFEMTVKVSFLYEIVYQDVVKYLGRNGDYEFKAEKVSKRFTDWAKLRDFAYTIKDKKILQVLEIKDMTRALHNDMTTQPKD
jgi:hypothetical protein